MSFRNVSAYLYFCVLGFLSAFTTFYFPQELCLHYGPGNNRLLVQYGLFFCLLSILAIFLMDKVLCNWVPWTNTKKIVMFQSIRKLLFLGGSFQGCYATQVPGKAV